MEVLSIDRTTAKMSGAHYQIINGSMDSQLIERASFDLTITDPPYAPKTQDNTRRGRESRDGISDAMPLGFDAATTARRERWSHRIAFATRRWAAVFSDQESAMDWANHLERGGMDYIRCVPWVRTGDEEIVEGQNPTKSGAPQFTGDRPAQSFEVIVLAHARGVRMKWNGGGGSRVYTHPIVQGLERNHPAQKPLDLMIDILRDFAQPGDVVWDPFCGAGTTLVAAKNLGLGAIGVELNETHAAYARRRVAGAAHLSRALRTR